MVDSHAEDASVRVLVVGDSRTGKTTFTNVLCGEYNALDADATRELMRREARGSTVGANVNVRLHLHGAASQSSNYRSNPGGRALDKHGAQAGNFATSPSAARHTAVEVIDVGGARQYALARPVFYDRIHAIILVHDVSNPKSLKSLQGWLREIAIADKKKIRYGGISARHQILSVGVGASSVAYSDSDGDIGGERTGVTNDTSSSSSPSSSSARRRMGAAELTDAQRSLIQRIPVLVLGNKLDLLSPKEQQYCMSAQYFRHVLSSVFAPDTAMESVQITCCSSYRAAEEANTSEPYHATRTGTLGRVLSFIDGVVSGGGDGLA
eukprot:g4985.t1